MEEKDVQRLLDMLYGMIDEAKSAAFSSDKCIINRDEALDLLDEIRAKLPLELKKARELDCRPQRVCGRRQKRGGEDAASGGTGRQGHRLRK